MILGDSYITFNRKISKFRGHYVSLESKVRGHLKQKWAKSPFLEGQGKPWKRLLVCAPWIAKYLSFLSDSRLGRCAC